MEILKVITLIIYLLFVGFGASSSVLARNHLRPFLVTNTKDGYKVTIHQVVEDGVDGGRSSAKKYVFTPVPKLEQYSVKHEYNNASGRHEVKFTVEIWNNAFLDELSALAGVHRSFLSVYPADSVKLAATGPGWDSLKYSLAKKHSSSSDEIDFVIACRKKEYCEDLLQQIQQGEPSVGPNEVKKAPIGFELQFRDHGSAAKGVPTNVSVARHVLPTMTFQRIEKKRLPEVLLTESVLSQFAEEVADNLLRIDREDPGLYIDFSDPEEGIEAIKAGLFTRKVNSSTVKDWSTVLSDEPVQQNRTHHVVHGPLSSAGRWNGRKSGLKNLGRWVGVYVTSIALHRTSIATTNKSSMTLYAINVAKLRSVETIGDVKVDIYPPDGVARFPVTIAKPVGAATSSPIKASPRQKSVLSSRKIVHIAVASCILLCGVVSLWKHHVK